MQFSHLSTLAIIALAAVSILGPAEATPAQRALDFARRVTARVTNNQQTVNQMTATVNPNQTPSPKQLEGNSSPQQQQLEGNPALLQIEGKPAPKKKPAAREVPVRRMYWYQAEDGNTVKSYCKHPEVCAIDVAEVIMHTALESQPIMAATQPEGTQLLLEGAQPERAQPEGAQLLLEAAPQEEETQQSTEVAQPEDAAQEGGSQQPTEAAQPEEGAQQPSARSIAVSPGFYPVVIRMLKRHVMFKDHCVRVVSNVPHSGEIGGENIMQRATLEFKFGEELHQVTLDILEWKKDPKKSSLNPAAKAKMTDNELLAYDGIYV